MSASDCDRHPPDSHRNRVANDETCTMERLYRHALVEPKLAQATPISLGQ